MNRDEILRRSREANTDERELWIDNRAKLVAITGFLAVVILLMLCRFAAGQPLHDLQAIFWAYIATEACFRYRYRRQRALLATALLSSFCALANLAISLMDLLAR